MLDRTNNSCFVPSSYHLQNLKDNFIRFWSLGCWLTYGRFEYYIFIYGDIGYSR